MTLYCDSAYPVPPAIDELHTDEIGSFASPGTWGSAAQRTAVAATARRVRSGAGLQESIGDEARCDAAELPAAVVRLVEAAALGGTVIDRAFYEATLADGVTEGAYVEVASVVARITNLDVFARGIGVTPRPLAEPVDDRPPSFERPPEATDEGFFTASVPPAPKGGALAESLYGAGLAGNILRSTSLVPEEARRVIALVETQYFPAKRLMDFTDAAPHALSRPQIELVATKVSEHNQCFY